MSNLSPPLAAIVVPANNKAYILHLHLFLVIKLMSVTANRTGISSQRPPAGRGRGGTLGNPIYFCVIILINR